MAQVEVYKDSVTGEFVSEEYARAHPRRTYKTTVERDDNDNDQETGDTEQREGSIEPPQ